MAVYAGEPGTVKCLPAVSAVFHSCVKSLLLKWWRQLNASDRYKQHKIGLRRRQGDDITERAEGFWYPVTCAAG